MNITRPNIGIIDCGSNTFNLLIADTEKLILSEKMEVHLGENSNEMRFIAPTAFQRALDALKKFREILDNHEVNQVIILATSAIRDAENVRELIQRAKEESALDISIIDGDREAELIYKGVKSSFKMNRHKSLIMDIGGGSTEFIIANEEEVFWKKSYRLGVSRLMEKFQPHDPLRHEDVIRIEGYIWEELIELKEAMLNFPCDHMIGSSGSFETLADMASWAFHDKSIFEEKVQLPKLQLNELQLIHTRLLLSNLEERLSMKGMLPMRAKMMVVSSLIVQLILHKFNLKELFFSNYSLKEGILYEWRKQVNH